MIKQEKKLTSFLCDIYYDRLGEKYDRKKRVIEAEDQRNNKSEQKQMSDDEERLRGLETCEVLVCSVL